MISWLRVLCPCRSVKIYFSWSYSWSRSFTKVYFFIFFYFLSYPPFLPAFSLFLVLNNLLNRNLHTGHVFAVWVNERVPCSTRGGKSGSSDVYIHPSLLHFWWLPDRWGRDLWVLGCLSASIIFLLELAI